MNRSIVIDSIDCAGPMLAFGIGFGNYEKLLQGAHDVTRSGGRKEFTTFYIRES